MQQILFNHIPKTGGTTLRIILNKVYGVDKVFFIKSKDIQGSIREFSTFSRGQKNEYSVISGHGSELFSHMLTDPFKICVIREPLSLFLSQYNYLKQSDNSNFKEDVSKLNSIDEYIDYAIAHGQDNLLTRYLSDSLRFLAYKDEPIPILDKDGDQLLALAKKNLHGYGFLTDLVNFDEGIYSLSRILNWSNIPIYRPSNITNNISSQPLISENQIIKIKKLLRWDLELYNYFKEENLDSIHSIENHGVGYKVFMLRQKAVGLLVKILRKR